MLQAVRNSRWLLLLMTCRNAVLSRAAHIRARDASSSAWMSRAVAAVTVAGHSFPCPSSMGGNPEHTAHAGMIFADEGDRSGCQNRHPLPGLRRQIDVKAVVCRRGGMPEHVAVDPFDRVARAD